MAPHIPAWTSRYAPFRRKRGAIHLHLRPAPRCQPRLDPRAELGYYTGACGQSRPALSLCSRSPVPLFSPAAWLPTSRRGTRRSSPWAAVSASPSIT